MPESPEIPQRLALYARVSTEEQREGQTIDSQISELERYSREKGWPIVGIYKDDGWSGGLMERPELDRLRDDAQKGLFDAVLINDVDRLARDVAHLGVIKRDFERKNVRVIFRKLPSDTSPTYNLMVNILGSFAEFERELIADRTRRGRRHKVETRKLYLGSNTAYGYRYIPVNRVSGKDGSLVIEPKEASVVRRMFEWVDAEGLSARRVLNRLNALRIPPKKGAAQWAKSSVLRILHCETYAGVWHYNKFQGCEPRNPTPSARYRRRSKCSVRQRPRGDWIPLELPATLQIVPRDRWERVQEQLNRNIAFSPRNEKHAYLLKGLIRCGGCGARYVGDPGHGRFNYRCIKRCKRIPSIQENLIVEPVKSAVTRVMVDPSVILDPLRQLDAAQVSERQERLRTARSTELGFKRLHAEEERILEAYRLAIISPTQLAAELEKVKAQRDQLQMEASHNDEVAIPIERIQRTVAEYCAEASRNLAAFTPDQWREFLRTIIGEIIFYGDHMRIKGRIPLGDGMPADSARLSLDAPVKPL